MAEVRFATEEKEHKTIATVDMFFPDNPFLLSVHQKCSVC